MSEFSERLKKLRIENGLRQSDIASELNVSTQSYSAYEAGREPKYDMLNKLANLFGVTVDYLTGHSYSRYPVTKISGDRFVDSLAGEFATMAKRIFDKASKIDDEITEKLNPPEQNDSDCAYQSIAIANSEIWCYFIYVIKAIGNDADFCLDNSDLWLKLDGKGSFSYDRDTMVKLLDKRYLEYLHLSDFEDVIACPEQPKTPVQSENDQTEHGKDD